MFDRWLNRAMRRKRVDRQTLARDIEVEPTTVARWLDEGRKPQREQVLKLAKYFGVTLETITRQTDPELFYDWDAPGVEQQALEDLFTDVPEMQDVARRLRAMTPKARRAWLTLLLGEDGESGEPDQ